MGQLPEQVQANLSTLQRLQLEQQATADSLRRATDAMLMLESAKSAGVPVQGTPPPPDSLDAMRALLTQLKTRYTDQHPDVRGLESRIEALEKSQGRAAAAAPPERRPSTSRRSQSTGASPNRGARWSGCARGSARWRSASRLSRTASRWRRGGSRRSWA